MMVTVQNSLSLGTFSLVWPDLFSFSGRPEYKRKIVWPCETRVHYRQPHLRMPLKLFQVLHSTKLQQIAAQKRFGRKIKDGLTAKHSKSAGIHLWHIGCELPNFLLVKFCAI